MPVAKPTSSTTSRAPASSTMSKTRLAPSSAANRVNADVHADNDHADGLKSKNGVRVPSNSTAKRSTSSSRVRDEDLDLDSGDESSSSPSEKLRAMEEKVRLLTEERDAYADNFAELKALRHTAAETDLAAYKKAADGRIRHSQDLIASLKARVDRTERALKAAGKTLEPEEDPEELVQSSSGEAEKLKREVEQLRREKKKADENVRRLELELRTETETSQRLLSSSSSSGHKGAGTALDADNRAVRRLYEDLTGIIISRVEACDMSEGEDGDERRRFTGVFSAAGHHNLQLAFEESSSSLPSSTSNTSAASSALRQDLIFIPHLDAARDRELLESKTLPSFLREEIRFDRALSVKFTGSLVKGLKM